MADWEVALDKQAATWVWWGTDAAVMVAEEWVRDVNEKYGTHEAGDRMIADQRRLLWWADPIYVTKEMGHLLQSAWETFEPEPLREDDLIVPAGFALLPFPFYITDVWGKRTAVRAIAWQVGAWDSDKGGTSGVRVSLYCNSDDEDDYTAQYDKRVMRRLYGEAMPLVVTTPHAFGSDIDYDMEDVLRRRRDADKIDRETARLSMTQEIRLLQCFWRLTKQRIAVGFQHRSPRGQRRRLEKAGLEEKYITVVTLRRPRAEGSGDHRAVDWHQRWIVSGHWRWQPYGDGTHRQIWIAPYVKGPEDKPLVIRGARVFRLAR